MDARSRCPRERECDAEIRDERLAVVEEDVFRFEVPVNDAVAVRIVERARHCARQADRLVDGELLLTLQARAERFAGHIRHDVEEQPFRLARVEERQEMRVLQVRGDANLGKKPLGPEERAELRVEDLESDRAVVPPISCEVDGGHPAAPDLALDLVLARKGVTQGGQDVHGQCWRLGGGTPKMAELGSESNCIVRTRSRQMRIALRLLGTVVVAAIGWIVAGYLATAPLGAIYGWSGHPAIPAAPLAIYIGLYAVMLPLLAIAAGWKIVRWVEARWRSKRDAGPR